MKLKHLLPLILTAVFLTGCNVVSGENELTAAQNRNAQSATKSLPDPSGNLPLDKVKVKPAGNAVCSNPEAPCHHKDKEFAEWELSFKLPPKIAANKTYRSAPFYAVLLKAVNFNEDCDGGEFIVALENERKKVQSLLSQRKVFASYSCPNMDAVSYDFPGRMSADKERVEIDNFIAIYGGYTEAEAKEVLAVIKDEYPKAQIKKMTAMWERIEQ